MLQKFSQSISASEPLIFRGQFRLFHLISSVNPIKVQIGRSGRATEEYDAAVAGYRCTATPSEPDFDFLMLTPSDSETVVCEVSSGDATQLGIVQVSQRGVVITSPGQGNIIVPDGIYWAEATIGGGGGSGGGGYVNATGGAGGGGGSGELIRFRFPVTPGESLSYTCGAGGIACVPGGAGQWGNASSINRPGARIIALALAGAGGGAGTATLGGAGGDVGVDNGGLWGGAAQLAGPAGAAGAGANGGYLPQTVLDSCAFLGAGAGGAGGGPNANGGWGGNPLNVQEPWVGGQGGNNAGTAAAGGGGGSTQLGVGASAQNGDGSGGLTSPFPGPCCGSPGTWAGSGVASEPGGDGVVVVTWL